MKLVGWHANRKNIITSTLLNFAFNEDKNHSTAERMKNNSFCSRVAYSFDRVVPGTGKKKKNQYNSFILCTEIGYLIRFDLCKLQFMNKMPDKLLYLLLPKHDRCKFPKANMSRTVTDILPVDPSKLFKVEKVKNLVHDIIDKNVDESYSYKAEECPQLCLNLTDELRKSIKELNLERYKFICVVQIFEKKTQGITSISRLLCDVDRDRYVVVKKENNNIYLIASVYAMYHP